MGTAISSATFNLEIEDSKPTVTRELVFGNGDRISFTVTLDFDPKATLPDIHRASVERVISLLQGWTAAQ